MCPLGGPHQGSHGCFMTRKLFLHYRPSVRGIHCSPVDFPHRWPVMQNFDAFFVANLNTLLNPTVQLPVIWDASCDVTVRRSVRNFEGLPWGPVNNYVSCPQCTGIHMWFLCRVMGLNMCCCFRNIHVWYMVQYIEAWTKWRPFWSHQFQMHLNAVCDLKIWRKTSKNNMAPLLCYFKLCATFHRHQWIQTGVTVRTLPIRVKMGDYFLSRVTLKFDGWPWKTIGHIFYATSSFVHHSIAIGEFKLELQSGNAQIASKLAIFCSVWPWNLTDDLEKQYGLAPLLCYFKL